MHENYYDYYHTEWPFLSRIEAVIFFKKRRPVGKKVDILTEASWKARMENNARHKNRRSGNKFMS
jgi:hypothetical protein